MPFKGITFTMPNFLWPLFQRNRKLLACLATLGAKVVENWAMENYGVRLMITVVLHTFSRHLTFHPHLHSIVGVFGLRESDSSVVPASFNHEGLMQRWRLAVITLLREALRRGELASDMGREELAVMLTAQAERWWNIHITHCKSKAELFRYIGRYARRPPIAEQRIIEINDNWVVFWTKDHKLKRKVETWYSPERFVDLLSEHVLDSNQHAVRHYGLLSPRSKNRTQALFFSLLNQHKRPRPKRLSNRESVKTLFNRDPLLDSKGQEMRLLCRLGPEQIAALRLMFPREFSLGRNTPIEIGPGLRRWLKEHASVCTDMNVALGTEHGDADRA